MIYESLEAFERVLVESILGKDAAEQFSQGAISNDKLLPYVDALKRISSAYNETTAHRSRIFTAKDEISAYALYFAPINFFKIFATLRKTGLQAEGSSALRILDFGCGPGTASLACKAFFADGLEVSAFDKSRQAQDVAASLWKQFEAAKTNSKFTTITDYKEVDAKFDLIIAANVINEVEADRRMDLLRSLEKLLTEQGLILIVEPALQQITRSAMKLRDSFLKEFPDFSPLFPCTRKDSCPMLKDNDRDWCHAELRWKKSRLIDQLDHLAGFNKHRIKYSAFVFQRGAQLLPGARVVNVYAKSKIGFSASLCSKDLFRRFTLKKRDLTQNNSAFKSVKTWDLVQINGPLTIDHIDKENLVDIMQSILQ